MPGKIHMFSLPAVIVVFCIALTGYANADVRQIAKEGDIIFQITSSAQSQAVQLATGSDYTHCGLVLEHDGELQVFEADDTVRWVPLEPWVKNGVNGHYVLMRLKSGVDSEVAAALRADVSRFLGKKYDILFQWSDETIYCSELIWKMFSKAGIELCPLRVFGDFNIDNPLVRIIVKERYNAELPPLEEPVVAPSDLMASDLLVEVGRNER